MTTRVITVVAVLSAVILTGYFGIVTWAWLSPSNDPQRGMAEGFLMMVTVFLLCLAGLLWYGVHTHRPAPIWIVFAICALPSLSLVGRGIYLLVRWFKQS
jgi:hypothetical protein